jgi:hypothetical protein
MAANAGRPSRIADCHQAKRRKAMNKRPTKQHQNYGSKKGRTMRTSKYDEMSFQELCSVGSKEVMKFLNGLWEEGVEFEELSPGEQTLFRIVDVAFDAWERQQRRQ